MLIAATMTDVGVGGAKGLVRVYLQIPSAGRCRQNDDDDDDDVGCQYIYIVLQKSCRHALCMSTTCAART